jgi:hypothetical protein
MHLKKWRREKKECLQNKKLNKHAVPVRRNSSTIKVILWVDSDFFALIDRYIFKAYFYGRINHPKGGCYDH